MRNNIYVKDTLSLVGLVPTVRIAQNQAYGLKVDSPKDLRPVFIPHMVRIRSTPVLAGLLGVSKQAFDYETKSVKLADKLELSCHSSNFPTLQSFSRWGEDLNVDVLWCRNVVKILHMFPDNVKSMWKMVEEDASIGGVPISRMLIEN